MLLIFDISGGEFLVILLFVLLFFGSKGIPGVARSMGRITRQLRDASADVQREIQKGAGEVKRGYEEQRRTFVFDQPENSRPQPPEATPPAANEPLAEEAPPKETPAAEPGA